MAIDISNKEEKQIALTGVEIEETLLQAHLSKDAIAKINGLQSSASEIDRVVLSNHNNLLVMGHDLTNHDNDGTWGNFLELSGWNPLMNGSNTPIFDNVNLDNYHRFGDTSLRIGNTTPGVSTSHGKTKILSTKLDLSETDIFTVWAYVDGDLVINGQNSSKYGQVLLVLGNETLSKSAGSNIFGVSGGGWHKGWNNITINKNDFSIPIGSAIDWTDIKAIQLRTKQFAESDGTLIYIDGIYLGSGVSNNKTPVCITLDDSNEESYLMCKIMNSYGIVTSNFVMPNEIDNHSTYTGTMTIRQVRNLYNQGNHIGFHHSTVGGFAINPQLMLDGKNWLISKGFTRDEGYNYGAYPNGILSQTAIDFAKNNGIKGLRSINGVGRNDSLGNSEATTSLIKRESICNGGIADPYRINSSAPLTSTQFESEIVDAIEHKAGYITYHHQLSEVGGIEGWTAMAKYLKSKINNGTIECLTFPQFCKKYSN